MSTRVLVVDDEPQMALAVSQVLLRTGYEVDTCLEAAEALNHLSQRDYGLVISDLRMPHMDGHELVRRVQTLRAGTPVIVVTAHGTIESAVECVRDGAANYLLKPFAPETLVQATRRALRLHDDGTTGSAGADFVAQDPATLSAVELAHRVARVDATVLLEAESGAGKELFARLIHDKSPRANGPFVALNCAAMPKDLLEAELFGHVKGAFTGALRERKGHFQSAHGGTLFLDEIGEMSPDLQARLLRVLQDHVVQPVGSERNIHIDVRVVAATHRNLREEVREGRFREDLYYRLRVLPLPIPPLRARPGDLEPLARRFAERYGGPGTKLQAAAIRRLREHSWPGNVRELENVIQCAAIHATDGIIEATHLTLEPALRVDAGPTPSTLSLSDAERETIHHALRRYPGNRSAAAAALGISARTLRHKLKQYRDAGEPLVEATS